MHTTSNHAGTSQRVNISNCYNTPAPNGTPDMILRNDKVITIDPTDSITQAVAVKDGLIQAVGNNEDQKITVQEALRAHTIGAAYAGFEESIKGSIEPGKLADLVVWSHDPYAVSGEELEAMTMDMTIVGGKIVYQVS